MATVLFFVKLSPTPEQQDERRLLGGEVLQPLRIPVSELHTVEEVLVPSRDKEDRGAVLLRLVLGSACCDATWYDLAVARHPLGGELPSGQLFAGWCALSA